MLSLLPRLTTMVGRGLSDTPDISEPITNPADIKWANDLIGNLLDKDPEATSDETNLEKVSFQDDLANDGISLPPSPATTENQQDNLTMLSNKSPDNPEQQDIGTSITETFDLINSIDDFVTPASPPNLTNPSLTALSLDLIVKDTFPDIDTAAFESSSSSLEDLVDSVETTFSGPQYSVSYLLALSHGSSPPCYDLGLSFTSRPGWSYIEIFSFVLELIYSFKQKLEND